MAPAASLRWNDQLPAGFDEAATCPIPVSVSPPPVNPPVVDNSLCASPTTKALIVTPGDDLDVLLYQLVTLKRGNVVVPLSKRAGEIVTLRDVVTEVGADAARFFFLTPSAGSTMEFDLELPVRMVWAGVPVRNLPTRVRYLTPAEGGVSHFDLWRDNARISWLHTRLVVTAAGRALASIARPGSAVR